MNKWYGGVTGLYLILVIICSLNWIAQVGTEFFPEVLFAYLYPYELAERGLDSSSIIPIIIIQFVVISTYVASVVIYKSHNRAANIIAGVSAVLWFVIVSIIIFVSLL